MLFRLLCVFLIVGAIPAVTIPTAHFDNSRTAWNSYETALTPTNIQTNKFGIRGRYTTDGEVYTQPLYLPGITVGGISKNLIIVATMNDSIYAFNADAPGSDALWSRLAIATPRTSYPDVSVGPLLYGHQVGCLSTPAADVALNVLFVVCHTATPAHILYKLNLSTGATVASVTISGQVVGTGDAGQGDTTSGANLLFYPAFELQRSALTVANGNVYIPFGSYADVHPWHGWLFAYAESDLSQVAIFCTSPNTAGAGLWGASGGASVDSDGNLYMMTGNGTYDGSTSFGESILKWSPTLTLLDWYTPSNWSTLNSNDSDMSSSRVMLIPGSSKFVGGAKDFKVYSTLTTCMGHLGGTVGGCTAAQVFATNSSGSITDHSGIYGGLYMNGRAYFPNTGGALYTYTFSSDTFNTTPTVSAATFEFPGAQLSGSSNGSANAIVWTVTTSSTALYDVRAGVLRALNPTTLAEYWNSTTGGDALGNLAKFAAPTIADGKVFVSTLNNTVAVYGLEDTRRAGGAVTFGGSADLK